MVQRHLDPEPMIIPLDRDGEIYAMQDEHGNIIGTGTREVCEVLVLIMKKSRRMVRTSEINNLRRANVRAAIVV
jgi:hypothetical protein